MVRKIVNVDPISGIFGPTNSPPGSTKMNPLTSTGHVSGHVGVNAKLKILLIFFQLENIDLSARLTKSSLRVNVRKNVGKLQKWSTRSLAER